MAETLKGGCHCGAVAFTARFDGPIETSKCNCSICRPTRYWKTLVPPEAFALDRGEEALGTYEFGAHTIKHRFCTKCGVKLHGIVTADEAVLVAISVPTLDLPPERLAALPIAYQDGAHDDREHPPVIIGYL